MRRLIRFAVLVLAAFGSPAAAAPLDSSFGGDGIATFGAFGTATSPFDVANAVAVQPGDGKVVLAGATNGTYDVAIVRLTAAGVPDTGFGPAHDGVFRSSLVPDGQFEELFAVTLQPDGKIVAVGDTMVESPSDGGERDVRVVRLKDDGTPDTSFGTNGELNVDVGDAAESSDFGYGVTVQQPSGKIVIAAQAQFAGTGFDLTLVRLNPDGSLDSGVPAEERLDAR